MKKDQICNNEAVLAHKHHLEKTPRGPGLFSQPLGDRDSAGGTYHFLQQVVFSIHSSYGADALRTDKPERSVLLVLNSTSWVDSHCRMQNAAREPDESCINAAVLPHKHHLGTSPQGPGLFSQRLRVRTCEASTCYLCSRMPS